MYNNNMKTFLFILIGYLVGSIPWALIIGKVFYSVDVREHGSGNLGGTNVLRTLGKLPGISVMLLDALKALIFMFILYKIYPSAIAYAGLAVCLGHCFPIFAKFKGGKAVACSCGYVLGLNLFIENKVLLTFVIPMLIWLIVMLTTKYMSLASMSGVLFAAITSLIFFENKINALLVLLLALFVIFMHRSNIVKLINHKESKLK